MGRSLRSLAMHKSGIPSDDVGALAGVLIIAVAAVMICTAISLFFFW